MKNRRPTADEWFEAYSKYPGQSVRQCQEAQKYLASGVLIHPKTMYCSYCKPKGYKGELADFPRIPNQETVRS